MSFQRIISIVFFLLGSGFVHAEDVIEVEYKGFYSHVKKLNGEDTQALQFAFGFQHVTQSRLCKLISADIVTQKQTIPLVITPENRFTVPSERALNLADATVRIVTNDLANQCDMSVQLETKPEYLKQYYEPKDLQLIFEQYAAFFNEMGSFLSFMMPQVDGLTVHFSDHDLDYELKDAPSIVNGVLQLNSDWLKQGKLLVLPQIPLRITARTHR
ncbi:DUF2987 domain-containing protein [Alteromonas facilis]|uniref:DUF2987 domain-containing protein n=1 Tax=Alteromonas facilis TaxID=2048004 RepID=UPI000C285082|nr:DUF2987 domain-containing protein [Alteromonas facilis]